MRRGYFSLYLRLAALAVLGLTAWTGAARAGDAEKLIVRVEKIYLKNATSEWVLAYDNPTDLDLSSELPEIVFVNDRLPEGDYWGLKFEISETLRVQGFAGRRFTRKGGKVRIVGDVAKASLIGGLKVTEFEVREPTVTEDKSQAGLMEVTLDLDFRDRDSVGEIYGRRNFPKPVSIRPGSQVAARLVLPLADTVKLATEDYFAGIRSPAALYFLPQPTVSEISVKVGAETRLLTSEVLEWEF